MNILQNLRFIITVMITTIATRRKQQLQYRCSPLSEVFMSVNKLQQIKKIYTHNNNNKQPVSYNISVKNRTSIGQC